METAQFFSKEMPSGAFSMQIEKFDRTPTLSREERQLIEELVTAHARGSVHPYHSYQGLERLLAPLEKLNQLAEAPHLARAGMLKVFFLEMHQRQLAYWGWSKEDWLDILGTDGSTFATRYQVHNQPGRRYVMLASYLFGQISNLHLFGIIEQRTLAYKLFGRPAVEEAVERVFQSVQSLGFRGDKRLGLTTIDLLLYNRSPRLEALSLESLKAFRQDDFPLLIKSCVFTLSHALAHLQIVPYPLEVTGHTLRDEQARQEARKNISPCWLAWCDRWFATSTFSPRTRRSYATRLLKVGRWLSAAHPDIVSPEQWDRELAAQYIAVVDRMTIGEWTSGAYNSKIQGEIGKPLSPRAKEHEICCLRNFFRDCQEWGWLAVRFDPLRSLRTPRSITARIGPSPRVIADDMWAKLLWAGLNLTDQDLTYCGHGWNPKGSSESRWTWYPLAMVRALAVVWLFAGLRSDEIRRLRVGCVRWQRPIGEEGEASKLAVCLLDVPVHKTGTAFSKPVDSVVGEAIGAWEKQRPPQPKRLDQKTGEVVHYLFSHRGNRIGTGYLNEALIPLLCQKAGVPQADARGPLTSHRARSTIATQLFNAKDPMSLFELQEWLGHNDPKSTQHYAKVTPTRLMKAFADAGYLERNLRMVHVLIDQEAVKTGKAAEGEAWRYYDLGHGYCTYDFFDQCPHRMACARCAFYIPKDSSRMQLLEGKHHLIQLMQMIPLSEEERAAVEDGIAAMQALSQRLADIPTPAGPTPRQLEATPSSPLITVLPRQNK